MDCPDVCNQGYRLRDLAFGFRCQLANATSVRLERGHAVLFSMHSRISEHPSKSRSDALEQGRASFRSQAWASAFSQLAAADAEEPLGPDDLVLLAQSALLTGREAEGGDLLSRAHQAFLGAGEVQRAVRCAFWLGFTLLVGGESAK